MKADITYEVRSKHIEGEGYGGTYTERTLWRVMTVSGKKVGDAIQIAELRNNAEADMLAEWLKEHAK